MLSGIVAPALAFAAIGQVDLALLNNNITDSVQGAHCAIIEKIAARGENNILVMHDLLVDIENLAN